MNDALTSVRCRAISVDFATCPDQPSVEMHILTDAGKMIAVVCDRASLFPMQQHIEQIGRAYPGIQAWKSTHDADDLHGNDLRSYAAAMWEGWPALH
jgi:hypothetical protein